MHRSCTRRADATDVIVTYKVALKTNIFSIWPKFKGLPPPPSPPPYFPTDSSLMFDGYSFMILMRQICLDHLGLHTYVADVIVLLIPALQIQFM